MLFNHSFVALGPLLGDRRLLASGPIFSGTQNSIRKPVLFNHSFVALGPLLGDRRLLALGPIFSGTQNSTGKEQVSNNNFKNASRRH